MVKSGAGGEPVRRKPKKASTWKTPQDVAKIAVELESLAADIRQLGSNMEKLEIKQVRPLMGNFENAVQKIREFTATQLIARLAPLAAKRGAAIHQLFEGMTDTKNS